jgi:hypothetical protein
MRKKLILIQILLLFFNSCDNKKDNSSSSLKSLDFENDDRAAIVLDTTFLKVFIGDTIEFWIPTEKHLNECDLILKKALDNGEFDFFKEPNLKTIKKLYRQYLPYINQKGDSIVFINTMCEIIKPSESSFCWKNKIILFNDGGPCFWSIKINLSNDTYFDLMTNGF